MIRDIAALNGHEMLPWDVWGAMVPDNDKIDRAFIDRLAEQSSHPDADPAALRAAYEDRRVAVPPIVFNNVLGATSPSRRAAETGDSRCPGPAGSL